MSSWAAPRSGIEPDPRKSARYDVSWKRQCEAELSTWRNPEQLLKQRDAELGKLKRSSGDLVRLGGLRSRPELNGCIAEVEEIQGDRLGRVLVRLKKSNGKETMAGRRMHIQPEKLETLDFAPVNHHLLGMGQTASSTGFGLTTGSKGAFGRSSGFNRKAKAMSAFNLLESLGPKACPERSTMHIGVTAHDPVEREVLGLPPKPTFAGRETLKLPEVLSPTKASRK
mmetsp:Transcript_26399/g.47596  ORF Transcript_26399/g.47596 Transcript_26399/m.47596 type:complete len:226 (+) Transcript_26399:46-723(+)